MRRNPNRIGWKDPTPAGVGFVTFALNLVYLFGGTQEARRHRLTPAFGCRPERHSTEILRCENRAPGPGTELVRE